MIWNEAIECADRKTMEELQLKRLKNVVAHVYKNVEPVSYTHLKSKNAGKNPAFLFNQNYVIFRKVQMPELQAQPHYSPAVQTLCGRRRLYKSALCSLPAFLS